MADIILALLREFGPIGAVAGLVVLVGGMMLRIEKNLHKRVNVNQANIKELKRDLEEKDINCEKHNTDLVRVFEKIDQIEKKDVKSDGRFDVIDNKLENLQTNMTLIGTDVKTILNRFVSKGMGWK